MKRAKKKKVATAAAATIEDTIEDTVSVEEVPKHATPAPEPAPSLLPFMPEEEDMQDQRTDDIKLIQRERSATLDYMTTMKRWRKTYETYFNNEEHWLWGATESEQARVLERLKNTDSALKMARAYYVKCHRELSLVNTLQVLTVRAALHPKKKVLPGLARMAALRLQMFRLRSELSSHEAETPESAIERPGEVTSLLLKHMGLAVAWNWFPMRNSSGKRWF